LNAPALASDGLTPTEEARRIDFLNFLIEERNYPPSHIAVETVVLQNLGHTGRNNLRADVIVYDKPKSRLAHKPLEDRLQNMVLVAEIKRDSRGRNRGINWQLEPALRLMPNIKTLGVYWDDENRELFTKRLEEEPTPRIEVRSETVANLPLWGQEYRTKAITVDSLTRPANLVATLFNLANIMRSHGVNDDTVRYRETVKLLLARHVDERQARDEGNGVLRMQVYPDADTTFMQRINEVYGESAARYSHAQSLFEPTSGPELEERALRALVESIQGLDLSSASNSTMQQVFMSFVPSVFKKKALSQYFTPISLIETVVQMTEIGRNDKVADPAMGTADFLTTAMSARQDDDDISQRVFGMDSDPKAYDLAVVNMILNHDGQSGLICEDSIRSPNRWLGEMNVALCNPPFGARTVERDPTVLAQYDLGHIWEQTGTGWSKTNTVEDSQQLGILFLERCWKLLREGGRLGLIWPEGYLSTDAHGYVRQWLLDHFQILALVELPRRIFVKSDADLRSNILVAKKMARPPANYPIYASMVRNVGYKLGGDGGSIPLRDPETGIEIRDSENEIVLASDFDRVLEEYREFRRSRGRNWTAAYKSDITDRPTLDMKPRRLVPKALENWRQIEAGEHVRLGDIADVVAERIDLLEIGASELRRPVEGQSIRAIEGIVTPGFPERCWSIAQRKTRMVCPLKHGDIIVGLVRPERRNIGVLLDRGDDMVAIPDGVAVVRVREEFAEKYPQKWLFSVLRSEQVRIQAWTEAGGTSYGKLDSDDIRNLLLPSDEASRMSAAAAARKWMDAVEVMYEVWGNVGSVSDRRPILNSPLIGLIDAAGQPVEDND
jgi:type I restriction enzyme M protein